jgi:acyl carrier protein
MSDTIDPETLAAVISVCNKLFSSSDATAADNFFILGGTSLTAIELIEELLVAHELELSLEAVFECETLGELALECKHAGPQYDVPDKV